MSAHWRPFSWWHPWQPPNLPMPRNGSGCQGQDCRPTQCWIGLKDHPQAAWREGDNSWCDYLKMEETQNNCPSTSVWGSMQDLNFFSDHEKGEEAAQNYMG